MQITRQQALAELAKRQTIKDGFNLKKICFPKQLAFIEDPADWVVASCSRRAGKTEACCLDLLDTSLQIPGATCLYITMTRSNAEKIIWAKLLELNRIYKLGAEANISKLSLTFPNRSKIYLSGCKDQSELDNFRGLAVNLVYLDEIQSFRSFIKELIDDVLAPTLADYGGKLKIIGTPSPIRAGFFWDILQKDGFSKHKWTFFDNPHIALKSKMSHHKILERELTRRGVTVTHPSVQREWFGEWVQSEESLVFHYNPSINAYDALPALTDYVIGVDIGFDDSDAIAVVGWHKNKTECYLVEELITNKQGITELSNQIENMISKYQPLKVVMDTGGLGKKIADEIRRRRSLPIVPAEKSRKIEYIEILNDAMRTKKFFAKANSQFAIDSHLVEWDYDKSTSDRLVIKDEPHSDILDSTLYCFREALHWLSVPEVKKVDIRTREGWIKWQTEQMEKNLQDNIERDQNAERQSHDIGEFPSLDKFNPWSKE